MHLTWRDRLLQMPYLRDFSNWPSFDISVVEKGRRKQFLTNKSILIKALANTPYKTLCHEHCVSFSYITHLLDRCMGGESSATPPLTGGLIPYARVRANKRKATLGTFISPKGNQSAFRGLLSQVPNLHYKLEALLRADISDKPNAQNVTPAVFHGEFKRILEDQHWSHDTYPYTTASVASESCRRYYHALKNDLLLNTFSKKQLNPKPTYLPSPQRAFKRVEIDEQKVDLNSSIHLQLNDELIPLRISRVSLMLCVDTATDCYLGYHLALTEHPSQDDMLYLLNNIIKKWEPMTITTPGLSYAEGSGFPSMKTKGITFGRVCLDNALAHLANTVRTVICLKLGSTLCMGLPATPKARNWVEHAFAELNRATHRFKSTTGSNVCDTIKESFNNSKKIPSTSLRSFEEALSVVLSEHNIIPQARLAGATPLELLNDHLDHHYIRKMPRAYGMDWSTFVFEEERLVHFKSKDNRMPFINFKGVRYSDPCLANSLIVGKKIRVRFDRRDIRLLKAYTVHGDYLGYIRAPLSWQRFSHSIRTRRRIMQFTRSTKRVSKDILANYFNHLLNLKRSPKSSLDLVRVYREFTENGLKLDLAGQGLNNTSPQREEGEKPKYPSQPEEVLPWEIDWVRALR